jgi:hypothetical protein
MKTATTVYNLPIPTADLNNLRAQAKALGLPTTAYIRLLLRPHVSSTIPVSLSADRPAEPTNTSNAKTNSTNATPAPDAPKPKPLVVTKDPVPVTPQEVVDKYPAMPSDARFNPFYLDATLYSAQQTRKMHCAQFLSHLPPHVVGSAYDLAHYFRVDPIIKRNGRFVSLMQTTVEEFERTGNLEDPAQHLAEEILAVVRHYAPERLPAPRQNPHTQAPAEDSDTDTDEKARVLDDIFGV